MFAEIRVDNIIPDPKQPRKTFPPDHIECLAASIAKRGLIQSITVRTIDSDSAKYMIVAGECRWRAHQFNKAETIRAEIVEIDEVETRLRSIVENLQRRDMNPIEEARAFNSLIESGYNVQSIVTELGLKSTAIVRQRLDLLDLDPALQKLVENGNLAVNMAWGIALAPIEHQSRIMRDIMSGKLKTAEHVKHAGIAYRDAASQVDAFAELPKASAKDLAALSNLEAKIGAIATMVQAGFKDGECVAAQRVAPDRVKTLADQLSLIRKHVQQMEHTLRCVATQSEIKLDLVA